MKLVRSFVHLSKLHNSLDFLDGNRCRSPKTCQINEELLPFSCKSIKLLYVFEYNELVVSKVFENQKQPHYTFHRMHT